MRSERPFREKTSPRSTIKFIREEKLLRLWSVSTVSESFPTSLKADLGNSTAPSAPGICIISGSGNMNFLRAGFWGEADPGKHDQQFLSLEISRVISTDSKGRLYDVQGRADYKIHFKWMLKQGETELG